jgi:arsenate reductase
VSEVDARQRVLFLCTANSARSQMAEGLLRELAGERFDVYSGGLRPGVLHPFAIRAMRERGIDIGGQHAKSLDQYIGKVTFAFVITLCDRAARECPVFAGTGQQLHWPFEDPAAETGSDELTLAKFREVRDAIETRLREWLVTLPNQNGGAGSVVDGAPGRADTRD